MNESVIERVATDVGDLREVILWNDDRGWDSLRQERETIRALCHELATLGHLTGREAVDPELQQLAERLATVEQEIDEQEAESEQWAENVEIKIRPIGEEVLDRADAHFGRPQGDVGVRAFCRHHLTNYDALMTAANAWPGQAKEIIRRRVDEAITKALEQAGIDEL